MFSLMTLLIQEGFLHHLQLTNEVEGKTHSIENVLFFILTATSHRNDQTNETQTCDTRDIFILCMLQHRCTNNKKAKRGGKKEKTQYLLYYKACSRINLNLKILTQ